MRESKIFLAQFAAASLLAGSAFASDLVYTPINPSFGGNPLNSSHLLGLANAQRDATASDAKKNDGTGTGAGGTGGSTSQSNVDLFIQQLQGRLLSALASQVTDAIFGDNPQDHGTIQFGDTSVEFTRTLDSISLTITAGDGTVTTIVVPQLVTSNSASTLSTLMAPQSVNSLTSANQLANPLSSGAPLSSDLTTPLN
jgi:curli production assembly/transport component CsgF